MTISPRNWCLLALVLLGLACGKRRVQEAEPEAPPPEEAAEPGAGDVLDSVAADRELERQFDAVMVERQLAQARSLQRAGRLQEALAAVNGALAHDPTSEEAASLRRELQTSLGVRAGETEQVLEDAWEAHKVRLEEQKVTVKRLLAEAEAAVAVQDWKRARRAYENALFIVKSARFSVGGADRDLQGLGEQADRGLSEIQGLEAHEREEQAARDTEAAIEQMMAEEQKRLLEARDRRARLLGAAIDNFNFEKFDVAITYANQVLAEEPDNTLAKDIVANATTAKHTRLNMRLLMDLKDSYRRWQVDLERTKVPSSEVLQWPSQSFWDRITALRRTRRTLGGQGRVYTAEEQAVANALETKSIDLAFKKAPFPQVVNYLTAASGLNFVVDPRSREDLEAVEVDLEAADIQLADALTLLTQQVSADSAVTYEVVGNVVRILKKEHQKRNYVLGVHPVADLTLGLTDFIPPEITQVGVDEDSEKPLFGGEGEEAPQPYGTIEELMELVRGSVAPDAWEDPATINASGKNLVVYNTPAVQQQVEQFLDDLRAFAGITITIESRFLTMTDGYLRDVGVDLRGLGGANAGPLAVLDDVTSGLDDNASAALDNSGPGVNQGGAALAPSSGLFFNDGADGDFRSRSENIFTTPLGEVMSALGGGTFQITYVDDVSLSMILRASEKSAQFRQLDAPVVSVYNTQRAYIVAVNQINYVEDFDVEVAQTAFIADPVIGTIQDGLLLDVRPTVSNDRRFITLETRPTLVELSTPIQTFTTLLGAGAAPGRVFLPAQNPVVIQLPELDVRTAESTLRVPDGGSVLMGGLKDITVENKQSSTPILGNIPVLNFLFGRQGSAQEVIHTMVVVTATITDPRGEIE